MRNSYRSFIVLFLAITTFYPLMAYESEAADSQADVQKKLKALEDAKRAGILSEEEYEKKTAELGGAKAPVSHIPPGTKSKTYRHPVGFKFMYPADWKAQDTGEMLLLTPPNQGQSPQGPTELYFVAGESVAGEGIYDAMDPAVVAYLDENVWVTFQDDYSVKHVKGGLALDRVMWATDFPHGDGTYPRSREIVADVTEGMTPEVRRRVVHDNAAALYALDG